MSEFVRSSPMRALGRRSLNPFQHGSGHKSINTRPNNIHMSLAFLQLLQPSTIFRLLIIHGRTWGSKGFIYASGNSKACGKRWSYELAKRPWSTSAYTTHCRAKSRRSRSVSQFLVEGLLSCSWKATTNLHVVLPTLVLESTTAISKSGE